MKNIIKLGSLSLVTSLLLAGCGGSSSSSDTPSTTDVNEATDTKVGYFIDSAVAGAEYTTTSELNGTTDRFGRFNYRDGDKVKLYIGKLLLGEVEPTDEGLITPKTLASQSEDSAKAESLILRVLQSLDSDSNVSNGINLDATTVESFSTLDNEIDILALESEENLTSIPEIGIRIDSDNDGIIDVNSSDAQTHFDNSIQTWNDGERPDDNESTTILVDSNDTTTGHGDTLDLNDYNLSILTEKQKYALAYMWNEEKLAYDVYTELNKVQPQKQLENIATRSEIKHIQMVEDLVQRYDINISNLDTYEIKYSEEELRALPIGKFGVDSIQGLYNVLYDKGIKSAQDALEVGCMVEVTDVNDLNIHIASSQEINAQDLVDTFDVLRSGSYSHYWSFDKGLKNMGVTEGCCSLGADYCKPDYPQNEKGEDSSGDCNSTTTTNSGDNGNQDTIIVDNNQTDHNGYGPDNTNSNNGNKDTTIVDNNQTDHNRYGQDNTNSDNGNKDNGNKDTIIVDNNQTDHNGYGQDNTNSDNGNQGTVSIDNNGTTEHGDGLDLTNYTLSILTEKQKYALAYMWNEEKLAYDVYTELNKVQPQRQLENISTKSEIKHIQMVEDLVQRYDINISNLDTYEIKYSEEELRALPVGKFGVESIQTLYDALYEKGIKSAQDALEVGCMVEVTDVNDLNIHIASSQEINAQDLVDTFDVLRSGSYSHYWSFDKGLKNMGVTEGCCSLGADYCKPDYPQNENSDTTEDTDTNQGHGNGGNGRN